MTVPHAEPCSLSGGLAAKVAATSAAPSAAASHRHRLDIVRKTPPPARQDTTATLHSRRSEYVQYAKSHNLRRCQSGRECMRIMQDQEKEVWWRASKVFIVLKVSWRRAFEDAISNLIRWVGLITDVIGKVWDVTTQSGDQIDLMHLARGRIAPRRKTTGLVHDTLIFQPLVS
jgi:hypothetical protein